MRIQMKETFILLALIAGGPPSMFAQVDAVGAIEELGGGALIVKTVDAFGEPIFEASITVYSLVDGRRTKVPWQPDKEVPFGTYVVQVIASGFARFSEPVSVRSRRTEMFACLRVGRIDSGTAVMPTTRVTTPGASLGCERVVILPVFCASNIIPVVSTSYQGSFAVEGLEAGRYVGVSVSPARSCGTVLFDLTTRGAKIIGP